MARCYYLDYISKGFLSSYDNDEYVCKLCGKRFATNDPQVKYSVPSIVTVADRTNNASPGPHPGLALFVGGRDSLSADRERIIGGASGTPPPTGDGREKGGGAKPPPQWSYSLSATASSQLPWKSSMRPRSTRWASSGSMGILASRGRPYSSAACWVLPSPKG